MSEKERFPPLGMSPAVWGPIFWATMHIVSLGYSTKPTEEERAGVIAFYNSLATTIPCPICKTHYAAFLKKSPVEAAAHNRQDLIHWVFELHNNVNDQLGKRRISFQTYVKYMQSIAAAPNTTLPSSSISANTVGICTVAAGIAALGLYFYYKK